MLAMRDDTMADAPVMKLSATEAPSDDGASDRERGSPRTRWAPAEGRTTAVLAMAAGLVVTAVASLTLIHPWSPGPRETPAGTRPPVPAPAPASSGMAIGGPTDVTVQMATYEPDESSGWHAHTGLHAVVVLSGELTFYDDSCRRRTYGPGDTYVGGQAVHLARNETPAPVEMAVTYMFPAGVSHTSFHIPSTAPAKCDVS